MEKKNDFSQTKKITQHNEPGLELYVNLFDAYLKNQRCLSETYRHFVCNIARLFLISCFRSKAVHINLIKAKDITNFIYEYARARSPYRTRAMMSALRSFLHYITFKGMLEVDLSYVIPPIAVWKMDQIPVFLTEDEIEALFQHCDKNTSSGLRDYTILCVLLNLGLRASEVANLTLDDFDWTNGEVVIKGKGSKISKLPLMQELGNALVTYLLKSRPKCSLRSFFISDKEPFQGLTGPLISAVVGNALKRAGIKKKGGAHLLRRSLATILINKGASLQEIGKLLRHVSINTTAVYAKVDFSRLRLVVLPWPENLDLGGEI